jgi:membrane protein implicated in regulation of membrane protease activity
MEFLLLIFIPYFILVLLYKVNKIIACILAIISAIVYYKFTIKRLLKSPFQQEIKFHSLIGEKAKKVGRKYKLETGEERYGIGKEKGIVKKIYGELIVVE